jgi:hypothetical protein
MRIDETPHYYRVRIHSPTLYDERSFRTIDITSGVRAVIARRTGSSSTEIQSLLFDKSRFTRKKAERWAREHMSRHNPPRQRRRRVEETRDFKTIDGVVHPVRRSRQYSCAVQGEPEKYCRHKGRRSWRRRRNVTARVYNPILRRANASAEERLMQVYREFLGRDPDDVVHISGPNEAPDEVAAVGLVTEIETESETIEFDVQDGVVLALDTRKNIWLLGDARIDEPNADLGEIVSITYLAQKDHIDGQVIEYVHEFGEDGGERPRLVSDAEGWLLIEGGDYYVTAAGIEN